MERKSNKGVGGGPFPSKEMARILFFFSFSCWRPWGSHEIRVFGQIQGFVHQTRDWGDMYWRTGWSTCVPALLAVAMSRWHEMKMINSKISSYLRFLFIFPSKGTGHTIADHLVFPFCLYPWKKSPGFSTPRVSACCKVMFFVKDLAFYGMGSVLSGDSWRFLFHQPGWISATWSLMMDFLHKCSWIRA